MNFVSEITVEPRSYKVPVTQVGRGTGSGNIDIPRDHTECVLKIRKRDSRFFYDPATYWRHRREK